MRSGFARKNALGTILAFQAAFRGNRDVELVVKINHANSSQGAVRKMREAAGERFAQIELAQSLYDIKITDTGTDIVTPPGMPPMPTREMSTEQAVEHLLELRERYGYSYIQVYDGQLENFAPVVARLAGK